MSRVLSRVNQRWLALAAAIGFGVVFWIVLHRVKAQSPVYQGKTVETWLFDLSAGDPKRRAEAEAAFAALGTNAVPELTRLVGTDDALWRTVLWSHATNFYRPVRRLLQARVDPPLAHALHPAAAQALGKLGPAAAPAVPALIRMLRKGNPYEQAVAAQSLADIGAPAVAPLIAVLIQGEGAAAGTAARALLRHYRWTGEAVPSVENPADDPTAPARQRAVEMLGASGRTNAVVIEVLGGAAQDPARAVRLAALKALADAGQNVKPALPQLVACSRDESPAVREWSARALGKVGPPARAALPALNRLAVDKDEKVRAAAQGVLQTIRASESTNGPVLPR